MFLKHFEFVGHDLDDNGSHPAASKFELIKNWPQPEIVRDVMSLIGFAQFYSIYIPFLEVMIKDLRALCTGVGSDYDQTIRREKWTDECQKQWDFIKKSILDDPCLSQYEPDRRFYLKTDFAQIGMGYVGCQPDSDPESLAAMNREIEGAACEFLTNAKDVGAPPRLRPMTMGSRKNRGYELRLHSHLGEGFALDWAINANRLYCWGSQRFTNISDCYSIKYLMGYEGKNPVILRLQLRLMLWPVDIVHRTRDFNVDSNYMSKLALDTRHDPLLKLYLERASDLRNKYPALGGKVILPENMPGYRPKCKSDTSNDNSSTFEPGMTIDGVPLDTAEASHAIQLHSAVCMNQTHHADCMSIYPIQYYHKTTDPVNIFAVTRSQTKNSAAERPAMTSEPPIEASATPPELLNNDVSSITCQLTSFQVILYGFGGGHLYENMKNDSLQLHVVAAADMDDTARSLMQDMMEAPRIVSSAKQLHRWLGSDDDIYVDVYIAHAPLRLDANFIRCWWDFQATIILSRHAL